MKNNIAFQLIERCILSLLFILTLTLLGSQIKSLTIAHAGSCEGFIHCAIYETTHKCSGGENNGSWCSSNLSCPGGSCVTASEETGSGSGPCHTAGYSSCTGKCNAGTQVGGHCTYIPDPTPVPVTPSCGGGPTCTGGTTCCANGTCKLSCFSTTPNCGGINCAAGMTCCSDLVCRSSCTAPPPPSPGPPTDPPIPECTCSLGYTCCPGNKCVPPNNPCEGGGGDPCITNMSTVVASLWVRVVSKENGNTYYWKGSQWNDPVKTNQSNWSAGGIDNTGNFTTYKINTNADTPTKSFDRTFNRISNDMDVTTNMMSDLGSMINPTTGPNNEVVSWQVIGDGCKPNKPTISTWLKPNYDGEYWSNQYCYGGLTTGLNAKGGPGGCYTERTGCNDPDIKGCEKWCSPPQLDGCAGKYIVPRPDAGPGDTSEDYGSLKYLETIINAFDNPYNGVSLTFDGAWTMSEHVFTKYEGATNFFQEVRIKPPTGYVCGNADLLYMSSMKYDANRKSEVVSPEILADGTCVYNAGNKGGILIPEMKINVMNTCRVLLSKDDDGGEISNAMTININPKALERGNLSAFGVSNDTRTTNAGLTNLWLANKSWTPFTLQNGQSLPQYFGSIFTAQNMVIAGVNTTGYKVGNGCTSTHGISCSPVISTLLNNSKAYTDTDYMLQRGYYIAHCDMQNPPTNTNGVTNGKCSGSPLCSFNRDKLNKICGYLGLGNCARFLSSVSCDGYVACAPSPTSVTEATDMAVINAQCISVCNTCELATATDGCGGVCDGQSFCVGGTNKDKKCSIAADCPGSTCKPFVSQDFIPGMVTNISNTNTDFCEAGNTAVTVNWVAPANADAATKYEIIYYPANAYATAAEAYTAWSHPIYATNVKRVGNIQSGTSVTIPKANFQTLGPDIIIAVQTHNPSCSWKKSPWATTNLKLSCSAPPNLTVQLVKDVTGTLTDGRCIGGPVVVTDLIKKDYPVSVSLNPTVPFGLTSPVVSGNPNALLNQGVYTFSNLWYLPVSAVIPNHPYKVTLNKSVSELASDNLVLTCPNLPSGNPSQNFHNPTSATQQGYVRFFFKEGFPAWWRTVGGLIGAHNGPITSLIPPSCKSDGVCIDSLAGANPPIEKLLKIATAGIPVSGNGNTVSAGTGGGGKTQNYSTLNAEQFAGNSTSLKLLPTENYAYFLDKINKLEITPHESISDLRTNGPYTKPSNYTSDGLDYYIWKIPGGAISINPTKWVLSGANPTAGKRVIILVDGSVTFSASPDTNLITTNENSYLLVVAKNDIVFDNSVGRDISAVGVNDITPVVSGIYIAGNTLELQGTDGLNVTDYQFVGKGVFAGLKNVSLERSFDDLGTGRLLNNLQPAELFIHDPQMVLNTPKFLREPMMSYQEVL